MRKVLSLFLLFIATNSYGSSVYEIIKNNDSSSVNQRLKELYSSQSAGEEIILELCGKIDIVEPIKLRSNTTIQGCGDNSDKLKITQSPIWDYDYSSRGWKKYLRGVFILDLENSSTFSSIKIKDLSLDGSFRDPNNSIAVSSGISFTPLNVNSRKISISNISIENNRITGFQSDGIRIARPNGWTGDFSISNINIRDNYLYDFDKPFAAISITSEEAPKEPSFQPSELKISDITISYNNINSTNNSKLEITYGFGIFLGGTRNVAVNHNTIRNFSEEAIRINDSYDASVFWNHAIDAYSGASYGAGGIKLNRVKLGRVLNNEVLNTTGPGLEFFGAQNIEVYGNSLTNNANHGIRVEAYPHTITPFKNSDIQFKNDIFLNNSGCLYFNLVTPLTFEDNITYWFEEQYINLVNFRYTCNSITL